MLSGTGAGGVGSMYNDHDIDTILSSGKKTK